MLSLSRRLTRITNLPCRVLDCILSPEDVRFIFSAKYYSYKVGTLKIYEDSNYTLSYTLLIKSSLHIIIKHSYIIKCNSRADMVYIV